MTTTTPSPRTRGAASISKRRQETEKLKNFEENFNEAANDNDSADAV